MLSEADKTRIFTDFTDWSGGWAPCSEGQIEEYVQASCPFEFSEQEIIDYLRTEIMEP